MQVTNAFEVKKAVGRCPVVMICDHASNRVPQEIGGGDLGMPAVDMTRHIAYDVGARDVAVKLAEHLGAAAVFSRFSRLVIDPNRGEDDPTLVRRIYDRSIIPANRMAGPEEVSRRITEYYHPYHNAVGDALDKAGPEAVLVSVHSFTPQMQGHPPRPWHVGVLWHEDGRLALPLMAALRVEPGMIVGDNEPYAGAFPGDTMMRHAHPRGIRHVLIEVRNDLITDAKGQSEWADRLAQTLRPLLTTEISRENGYG